MPDLLNIILAVLLIAASIWAFLMRQRAQQADSRIDKTYEDLRRFHQKELKRLLNALPHPCFIISRTGKIIRLNRPASSYLGERQVVDRDIQEVFLDPPLLRLIQEALGQIGPNAARISLTPTSLFSSHGERNESFWDIDIRPLSKQDQRDEILLLMEDVTKSVQNDQVRKDFVANASHELRTPLSIIKGYLENLVEDDLLEQPEMAQRVLGTMQRHVDRITRIIEDMLMISRLESGEAASLKIEPFELRDCINDIIDRLDPVISSQKAKVILEMEVEELILTGDRFYWTQALFNLVENALKQNATMPIKVVIEVIPEGKMVSINIKDNGVGIPGADLPYIFKRFFRVEKHHSQTQVKGTGLGLSIVKRAIEAHGGTITASSTPGIETSFSIQTPQKVR